MNRKEHHRASGRVILLAALVLLAGAVSVAAQDGLFDPSWSREELLVRQAYMKLATYNRAANMLAAADEGRAHLPEDDLKFALSGVRTGPISEIYNLPFGEFVTQPIGPVLQITREVLSQNNGPRHVSYEAHWMDGHYLIEDWNRETVGEMLSRDPERFGDIGKYTAYTVTVSFQGQQRTHRGLLLFREAMQSVEKSEVEIFDFIVGGQVLAEALAERLPAVRAPWRDYVKSPAYRTLEELHRRAEQGLDGGPLARNDELEGVRERLRYEAGWDAPAGESLVLSDEEDSGRVRPAASCPPGALMESGGITDGMCCDYVHFCCFPYDPMNGLCDAMTCGYPACVNMQPGTGEPPPSCQRNPIRSNPKEEALAAPMPEAKILHAPNGGSHGAWARFQSICDYFQDCSVECDVKKYQGNYPTPPQGNAEIKPTIDGLFHVATVRSEVHRGTGGPGAGARCGRVYAVAWRACLTIQCAATLRVTWKGFGFEVSSSDAFLTWFSQETMECAAAET